MRLERRHVHRANNRVLLTLASEAIRLPQPVATVVEQLCNACDDGRWLFPGAKAQTQLHSASMNRRLQKLLGIPIRAARTGALMGLATEVPAPILADLLGYCNDTASRWRREASGDWVRYASLATTPTT